MCGAYSRTSLGFGFDHASEGIPAKRALQLQVKTDLFDGGVGQCFVDDGAIGFGTLLSGASQFLVARVCVSNESGSPSALKA